MDEALVYDRIRVHAGDTGRDLHIDTPLTNLTIGYRPVGLIADLIYPVVPVTKQNDFYYVWPRREWLRIRNAERSKGAPANRIQFAVSSDNYFAKNFALAMDIPLEDLANADDVLQLRSSGANQVIDNLALNWERRIATTLTDTTNMGSSTSLANRWSDHVNGDPVGDIYTGFESIRSTTGMDPNKMIISAQAWNNMRTHPDIIDFVRGKGDTRGGGPVPAGDIASAFGLQQVMIARGVQNTGQEGAASGTFSDIWSTSVVLLHVAPSPGIMVPSHGYTLQWRPAGLPGPFAVDRYEDRRNRVETVEVHHWQDEKVTASELGYLIVNA